MFCVFNNNSIESMSSIEFGCFGFFHHVFVFDTYLHSKKTACLNLTHILWNQHLQVTKWANNTTLHYTQETVYTVQEGNSRYIQRYDPFTLRRRVHGRRRTRISWAHHHHHPPPPPPQL